MSVWTHIEGHVSIYKKDRVSVKKVIEETLTDEACIYIDTVEFPDYYRHTIECDVCMDGDDFIKLHKAFIKELNPIPGTLDLSCDIRLIQ